MLKIKSELPVNDNPKETKYYGGVTNVQDTIKQKASLEVDESDAGRSIKKSFVERPMFKVDQDSPGMKKSELITKNADDIIRGVSNEYVDCNKIGEKCETIYTNAICNEASRASSRTCVKKLVVSTELKESDRDVTITIGPIDKKSSMVIDLTTGKVLWTDNSKAIVSVTPLIPNLSCATLKTDYSFKRKNNFGSLKVVTSPSCANNFKLRVDVSSGFLRPTNFTLTFHFHNQERIISDNWNNGCIASEDDVAKGISKLSSEVCTVPKSTKIINGASITRDCWEKTVDYEYGEAKSDNNCDILRRKGCEQIMSSCSVRSGDYCLVHEQTFSCPQSKCSNPTGIICNGTTFCMDGNCADDSYKPNDEFAKETSNLTGAVDASKQFNQDSFLIFNGKTTECSQSMIGYYNCCNYKGWGVNWGLIKCSDEEKKLAHAREEGLAIKVGRYCAHRVLGICKSHHETYCVFQSKQARIIQEQGRNKQLNKDFGSAKNPNCQGITPEQMQQINFDQIDFSEFYSDLNEKTKAPNIPTEVERVKQRVEEGYKNRSSRQ